MSNMPSNMSNPAAARAKIGIVDFNNKAKASVSTDELRQRLLATLTGDGIDAVALNASSASEAATEAKAKVDFAPCLFPELVRSKITWSGTPLTSSLLCSELVIRGRVLPCKFQSSHPISLIHPTASGN